MPRKSLKPKLKDLKQADAKLPTTELTTLDQIWGFNENSRYGTMDEEEYFLKLKDMTRVDLENHARAVGSMVVESSERMRDELMKQFRSYVLHLRKPVSNVPKTSQMDAATKRVMNEGR